MSDVRQLHLRDNVGYIDVLSLPPAGGCNFLCLSDLQCSIIRSFVFPFARWPTRYVVPVSGGSGTRLGALVETSPDSFGAVSEEIDDLELQINGGGVMGCESIAAALVDLAEAIAAQTAGGGANTYVNCGGGAGTGAWTQPLSELPDSAFIPPTQPAPPDPGVPPEGFLTWAEYRTYKCQAAHAVYHAVYTIGLGGQGLAGVTLSAQVIVGIYGAAAAVLVMAWPAAAVVAVIAGALAMCALSVYSFQAFNQWCVSWQARKDDIICGLYNAGTGPLAISVLTTAVTECIDDIVWSGALEGLQSAAAPLMAGMLTDVIDDEFVSSLFRLVTAIEFEGADCSACGDEGLLENWQFDSNITYWTPTDGCSWSAGRLKMVFRALSATYTQQSITIPEAGDYYLSADFSRTFDSACVLKIANSVKLDWGTTETGIKSDIISLGAGEQLVRLECAYDPEGGTYGYWDNIYLVAV